LIDNSIKYKDPKKSVNKIFVNLVEEKDNYSIIIEDNGLGIEEKYLPHIFQRGFRIIDHSKKNNTNNGHGIGLAIVKNIIDKHNWTISVQSSLYVGSVFTIIIPK